jgi:hypothetical protein
VAVGGVAIGLFSVGGIGIGLVALGGVAVGLVAVGAVSVELVAIGAVAMGLTAVGAVAVGLLVGSRPPDGGIAPSGEPVGRGWAPGWRGGRLAGNRLVHAAPPGR